MKLQKEYMPKTTLKWLNKINGADEITYEYCKRIMSLEDNLIGAVLGSAYGGEVEALGTLWKDKGIVYGLDTFEGHPKHLVPDNVEGSAFEKDCMDTWYNNDVYGKRALTIEYQREVLDSLGLDNVHLIKGEVHKDSLKDVPYLNYALLDMDIYESMKSGYEAVKDKIKPGFALFFHDATPPHHIPRVHHLLFDEILEQDSDMWRVAGNWESSYLVMLVRK